jgi:hypothetical protein
MNRKLHILDTWPSRLLLIGMGLFGISLLAQTAGDQPAPAPQQQAENDQKKAPPKPENSRRQPDLGVAVDSGRKSDVLANSVPAENNEGTAPGVYVIKQSAEFGGRITDFTGNRGTWDTFVNLGTGPRLLEYTLDMHSPAHTGFLFDDLMISNFGYGGDPNNLSRVRAQKGKIYSFSGSFRRDQNIFDYDLFANPLNPPTSVPNVPIINSPHEFLLTRRMSDANLNLFPVGNIRFKLGWSRVVNEGSTFTTDHQGTDALLFQPTLNTTDNYNFGISLRLIPRTNINYDQFYTYFKGDTTANLPSVAQMNLFGIPGFTLAGGIPVNLGLPFSSAANIPCAPPIVLGTGFANPACNGFFSYNRFNRNRNSFPTEQFSFQSNYFRRVDFSGRLNYSDAEANNPSTAELFDGLSRNRLRRFGLTGGSLSHRLSLAGDLATTVRITEKFRIVDSFRYDAFRIPGNWSLVTTSLFGANLLSAPNTFTPGTCPPPFTAATCPQHVSGSGADLIVDNRNDFLGQKRTSNTFLLEYDFAKNFTAHVGYRFERSEITQRVDAAQVQTFFPGPTAALANRGTCAPAASHPLNADGTCTVVVPAADAGDDFVQINGHTGLIGFAARPTQKLRISGDAEFFSGDNTFFRITPRHLQDYRIRANYKAKEWATFGAAIRILENRNTSLDIGSLQHNRSYGFSGVFAPPDAIWGVDLSYDYNDVFSQTNICFVATPAPAGSLTCGAPFLSGLSLYTNLTHSGSGSFVLRPSKRVTAGVGYAVTSSNGNTLILNPIAPTGPLSLNYHLPTASIAFAVSEKVTFKSGWNYYGYNEKSDPGPSLPRDFRGNMFSLSLRYIM